jgi:hypothetical protein
LTTTILLACGGLILAAMGFLRLARRSLAPMPAVVAVLSIAAGAGVIAASVLYYQAQTSEPDPPSAIEIPLDAHREDPHALPTPDNQEVAPDDEDEDPGEIPTTTDDESLKATLESITVAGDRQALQAIHVISLENTGDAAFTGPLALPLLPGATAINPIAGLDREYLEIVGGAMISTEPVLPGPLEITYAYLVPAHADGTLLERRVLLDTQRFELLVGPSLELVGESGLTRGDDVSLGADDRQTFESWRALGLDRGERLEARIVAASERSILLLVGGGILLAGILVVVLFPLLRRKSRGSQTQPA